MKLYFWLVVPVILALGFVLVFARAAAQDGALQSGAAQSSSAQQPQAPISQAFTYQGYLNKGTQAVNGTCAISIAAWDSLTAGTLLNSNTFDSVLVVNGLFTVQLDYGANFFTGQALWLETSVKCSGDASFMTLSPRLPLTAAPYASYASHAFSATTASNAVYATEAGYASNAGYANNSATASTAVYATEAGYAVNNWGLAGNSGTGSSNFLGTLDNTTLNLGANGQVGLRIQPGVDSPNIIGGYSGNIISPTVSGGTIAGGGAHLYGNTVSKDFGATGGGLNNHVNGLYGVIAGGASNQNSGSYSGIGSGYLNNASKNYATIGGGAYNTSSGLYGTVAGGGGNTASGYGALVPGGLNNLAQGDTSFAAGNRAKSLNNGCFTWADSNDFDFNCPFNNAFIARATGGVYFISAIDGTGGNSAGVWLPSGGSGWGVLSDRSSKTNLAAVNGGQLLEKLAQIPIETWSYKTQDASIRHIGPMAQDFSAAFGVGEDNTHINTVDADGVSLAAIQALYRLSQDKDAQIADQREQITTLQTQVAALQDRLDKFDPAGSTKGGLPFDLSTIFSLAALAGVALLWLSGQKKQEG